MLKINSPGVSKSPGELFLSLDIISPSLRTTKSKYKGNRATFCFGLMPGSLFVFIRWLQRT
jgi:hypothetical protein